MHEDDVGVAAEPGLVPAVAAHRDHREPGWQRAAQLRLDLRDRGGEHGVERGRGDRGQRLARLRQADQAEDVRGGDPEQLAAAQRADRDRGLLGVAVMPPGRGHHLGAQRVGGLRHQLGVVGEQGDRLGRAQQQAGGVPARGEYARHPLGGLRLVPQQPQEPR